jgi:RNA polymerase sigma-70 factor, ECF subfamily
VLATLIGQLRDIALAEDALQDALVSALDAWSRDGVPHNPGAWLTTTARRKAIDRIRAHAPAEAFEAEFDAHVGTHDNYDSIGEIPDERLKLMFVCCHPELPLDQRIALTLHTLGGLTTEEIATAFLLPVPTLAQRLVRAKKKIKDDRLPYDVPPAHQLAARLASVSHVIYLIFSEGYAASSGEALIRHDLCEEAIRLAHVLERLTRARGSDVPVAQRAEVLGLLALMLLHHSRRRAREDAAGQLVLLEQQDRALWDRRNIAQGLALLDTALQLRAAGPYQVQACISAVHALAATAADTDWREIAALYDVLLGMADSPVVRINHAVATGMASGPGRGLALLDALVDLPALDAHPALHAARADLLFRAGRHADARLVFTRARDTTLNRAERDYFARRIAAIPPAA